jgi:phosphopantetheinyl transferase
VRPTSIHLYLGNAAEKNTTSLLLSGYVEVAPELIQYGKGPYGKPFVSQPKTHFHFNISHSGDKQITAVSLSEVGVDLEKIREDIDIDKISKRLFSKRLIEVMQKSARAHEFFFRAWTFYEAFLKAQGLTIFSGEKFREEFFFEDPLQDHLSIKEWKIYTLKAPAGFIAAVATTIDKPEIKYFEI